MSKASFKELVLLRELFISNLYLEHWRDRGGVESETGLNYRNVGKVLQKAGFSERFCLFVHKMWFAYASSENFRKDKEERFDVLFKQFGELVSAQHKPLLSKRLIQDNHGHWYVILSHPDMERVFNDWLKAVETGEFNDQYGDPMLFPNFESMRVDGPHSVNFFEQDECQA